MSYKYKLIPEGVYNQLIDQNIPGNVLNSRMPPEAKVLLYQEQARNLLQKRLNKENKPRLVSDTSLQSNIENLLNILKAHEVENHLSHGNGQNNNAGDDVNMDNDDDINMDNDDGDNPNVYTHEQAHEGEHEYKNDSTRVLKRKLQAIRRPNKKFLMEKQPTNSFEAEKQELKDRIKSIQKKSPSQYRFIPYYKPIKPKYGKIATKRKIEANAWEEFLESGVSSKATIRPPPPLNIPKLIKQRHSMDKKIVSKRLIKDDQDESIPKRSQRLLNKKIKGWTSYKF